MRMWSKKSKSRHAWRLYGMLLMMMLVGLGGMTDVKGQTVVQLVAGDSYSLAVRLDSAYSLDRLTKLSVFVGNKEMCSTANGTLPLAVGQTRVYKCNLSSETTGKMRGDFQLVIGVTDTQMGVKNKVAGTLRVATTMNATRANVVNGGFDTVVEVVMGSTQLTTSLSVLNLVRGYSAYEVAVQNGFVGNEAAWLASISSYAALKANNLSDLTNAATARTNLGLGTLATQSGTFSGTSSGTNTGDQDLSGYELLSNKQTDLTASSTRYPSINAVNNGLATKLTIPTGLTTNFVPKWNGGFVNSLAFDNGNTFTIGTNTNIDTYSRLYVFGGANGANIDARPGGGGYDQSIIDLQGSNYATNFNSVHLRYQGISGVGTTLGYSNTNLADLTYNYAANDRAFLIRSQGQSPIVFGVDNTIVGKFGTFGLNLAALEVTGVSKTGGIKYATSTKTSAYTITTNDYTIRCDATNAAFSVTLPTASTVTGQVFEIKKIDSTANAITIVGTLDDVASRTLTTQYSSYKVQSNGTIYDIL